MPRFLTNSKLPFPVFALGLLMVIGLQACNHLERGAITVNCEGSTSEGDSIGGGRAGCTTKDPSGEIANNTGKPCNSGVVCEASGTKCSRSKARFCKNHMLEGGDCTCACL